MLIIPQLKFLKNERDNTLLKLSLKRGKGIYETLKEGEAQKPQVTQ